MKRALTCAVLLSLTFWAPAIHAADWPQPDYENSIYWIDLTVPVAVFSTPDGAGDRLDAARLFGGGTADATIHLLLVEDQEQFPLPNFPAEDMWLTGAPGSTFVSCPGGTIADGPTDIEGRTTWSHAQRAGGHLDAVGGGLLWIMVEGVAGWGPGLAIHMNSADITRDLVVDLADVALFTQDYYGEYDYRSDFVWDGVLNLSDVGRFVAAIGANCVPE